MTNIAILGAGLSGRLLSLCLKPHCQVSLYEKGGLNDPATTGRLAAAMVAPTAESVIASSHTVEMGAISASLWNELLKAIECPNLYQQRGTLVLAHRQDSNDMRHFQQRLKQLGGNDVLPVERQSLLELEPELAHQFQSGLYLPQEGHVDNFTLYDKTESLILKSDIQVFCQRPVTPNEISEQYDIVIDCRGLGAKPQLMASQLRGVRGEVLRLKAPEVNLSRPVRLMHPRYPIYIAPKLNSEYVVGATEIESEDNKAPTVRSAMELLSAAYSVHSGFAEAEILTIRSGLRPTLIDNEPAIFHKQQLIQVNGLYRHGYMISPYVVLQVLLLLQQKIGASNLAYSSLVKAIDPALVKEI